MKATGSGEFMQDLEPENVCAATANGVEHVPRQIVIVDDEPLLCEIYGLVLCEWCPGVSIQSFCDGLHAWHYLEQHDPDLLIMDLNRPGMDGIETLRRLATLKKTYPILVASGSLASLEKEARRAAGPLRVSFRSKPCQIDELRSEMVKLFVPG
jgi:CheY-like chemotaxis protein